MKKLILCSALILAMQQATLLSDAPGFGCSSVMAEETSDSKKAGNSISSAVNYAEVLEGDVTNDGSVNAQDLMTLMKALLNPDYSLTTDQYNYCDVNQDKTVNILDLIHLKKILLFTETAVSKDIECQSMVGKNINDVLASAFAKDVNIVPTYVYNEEYSSDIIIEQDVSAGEWIAAGSTVNVKVSNGNGGESVPDYKKSALSNYHLEEYLAILDKAGIAYKAIPVEDTGYSSGCVIKTNPPKGCKVQRSELIEVIYVDNDGGSDIKYSKGAGKDTPVAKDTTKSAEDKTSVVCEDGVYYTRIESSSVYSGEQIEKINDTMKTIGHDAVERFGTNGRHSIAEGNNGNINTPVRVSLLDGPFKNVWLVENASADHGLLLYDNETLQPLTFKKFLGEDWAKYVYGSIKASQDDYDIECKIRLSLDEETLELEHLMSAFKVRIPVSEIDPEYLKDEDTAVKTSVVCEDGVYYTRIESSSVYSDEQIEKINETMKTIGHDAVEHFGTNGRHSIAEGNNGNIKTPVRVSLLDGPFKNVWLVENASADHGLLLYDNETLQVLTFNKFLGDNWKPYISGSGKASEDDYDMESIIDLSLDKSSLTIEYVTNAFKLEIPVNEINPEYLVNQE